MAADVSFTNYCCDLLASVGPCTARRMFGGAGISTEGLTFALPADLVEPLPQLRIDSPMAYWLVVRSSGTSRPEVKTFWDWLGRRRKPGRRLGMGRTRWLEVVGLMASTPQALRCVWGLPWAVDLTPHSLPPPSLAPLGDGGGFIWSRVLATACTHDRLLSST